MTHKRTGKPLKKRGPVKDESLKEGRLRVSGAWVKEVDAVVPERERSMFMRAAIRDFLDSPLPLHIDDGAGRPFETAIDWVGHRGDLERIRARYGYMGAEAIRTIVLAAARKMKD